MGKSFFQKLIDGLFEEVIVEESVEDSVDEEVELPPVSNVIKTKKSESERKPETTTKSEEQIEVKKEARSNMINIDDVKEPQVKSTGVKEIKTKQEYEFTQVISPIFGLVGNKEEHSENIAVSSTTKKKNIKTNSVLGTVISPIYGLANESVVQDQEYEIEEENLSLDDLIEKSEENNSNDFDSIHHEANFDSLVKSLEEHHTKSEQKKETVSECQNLSLFDDFDEDFRF